MVSGKGKYFIPVSTLYPVEINRFCFHHLQFGLFTTTGYYHSTMCCYYIHHRNLDLSIYRYELYHTFLFCSAEKFEIEFFESVFMQKLGYLHSPL